MSRSVCFTACVVTKPSDGQTEAFLQNAVEAIELRRTEAEFILLPDINAV